MPPDVIARAFDPFFTTKDVGHGTGLGLSQVYGFVKQSRGHVKIYSEVGEGTTIKLYLPRVHAAAATKETEVEKPVARGSPHETILVVEDDEDVRNYSCETLRELGYHVFEAETGRGWAAASGRHPGVRVLFTDIGLPGGMNGRQLADEARKRRPDLRVLFTTAYARNAIVHDGRLDPGVELITKPYTQAALAAKLRDIIDARQSPGRILLVEDEALIQMLATEYLQEAGFKVDTAGSATEAMNKLALVPVASTPSFSISASPTAAARRCAREIRAIHPSLPIVLATGHGATHVARSFQGRNCHRFCAKALCGSGSARRFAGVGHLCSAEKLSRKAACKKGPG